MIKISPEQFSAVNLVKSAIDRTICRRGADVSVLVAGLFSSLVRRNWCKPEPGLGSGVGFHSRSGQNWPGKNSNPELNPRNMAVFLSSPRSGFGNRTRTCVSPPSPTTAQQLRKRRLRRWSSRLSAPSPATGSAANKPKSLFFFRFRSLQVCNRTDRGNLLFFLSGDCTAAAATAWLFGLPPVRCRWRRWWQPSMLQFRSAIRNQEPFSVSK